ncbi:MAG: glutaminyl-peptide cyclotransferase [bacterium]
MPRIIAICLSLITGFAVLLFVPTGNAQFSSFGNKLFPYSLTAPADSRYASSLSLNPDLSSISSLMLNPGLSSISGLTLNPGPTLNPGLSLLPGLLLNPGLSQVSSLSLSPGLPLNFDPSLIADLSLIPDSVFLISGQNGSLSGRYSSQASPQQVINVSVAGVPSAAGMYGTYRLNLFPQGALTLSLANGLLNSNLIAATIPQTPVNAFSVSNSGNYVANTLLGLGSLGSISIGSQGFQSYAAQPYIAHPYTAQPYATQPYISQPYSVLPYAALQGGLISWPRAEVVAPVVPVYYTYTVVNAYPHDRIAFTQGLVFSNGFLYEGTGIPGHSQIRRVDLSTGTILQSLDLPAPYWGEGITIYANKIIQLTWLHNIGFVYDKFTFVQLQSFTYPTEGWGITHDGTNLIMSDGTATLHFLDPVTFAEVSSIDVYDQDGPVTNLNELEYIKGVIYANVWLTDRIAIISPLTGQVVGYIDLSGLLTPADLVYPVDVLNGIAYDAKNDRLFVTGKFWPKLFEIDLVPLP